MNEAAHSPHGRGVFSDRAGLVFCAAAVGLLTVLTFAPALNRYRVSDDFFLVGRIDFATATQYFHHTAGFGRNEFRPLVLLSYAWDNWVWRNNPVGYHLTNLLLHTACGMLLLLVLFHFTGNLLLAFAAATLFALNPTHHAQVAWVTARDSLICLLFLLISWLAHLYYRQGETGGGPESSTSRSSRFWRGLSWLSFLAALSSYEGAVAFPPILLAIEWLFGAELCWQERARHSLRITTPFFLILAVYLAWWTLLFRGTVGGYDLDWSVAGMASDFYRMHYRLFHHAQHWFGVLYLVIGWLIWRIREVAGRFVLASVALIWLGHVPFLPVRGYADRFGFLSSIGVALLLSLPLARITVMDLRRLQVQALLPLFLLFLLSAYYANSTGRRLREWQEAGVVAESVVTDLKALHPVFPPNAIVVLDQIPTMFGNAYVFPTGLRAALRERYRQQLPKISFTPRLLSSGDLADLARQGTLFHFRYFPKRRVLREIH